MNQTENFALPQWEKDDRILMDDFNNAMAVIDATLTKIVIGTYTGNSAAERTIELPFTPKAVFVTYNGLIEANGNPPYYYGGFVANDIKCNALEIVDGGFKVKYETTTQTSIFSNYKGYRYSYIAFG